MTRDASRDVTHDASRDVTHDALLCMGVLRPASFRSFQLSEPVRIIRLERRADPSHLLARSQGISHTLVLWGKVFIVTYLSFREAKSTEIQVFKLGI